MKYSAFLFICIITSIHVSGQPSDTVFLLKENNGGGYHAIFIETNKKSVYYDEISGFNFDDDDREAYTDYVSYLKGKDIQLSRHTIKGISRQWILIKQCKNKFYAYKPSDFIYHYKVNITDTAFIDYGPEGLSVRKIESFTRLDDATYKFKLTGISAKDQNLTIHIIDKKRGIAIFNSDDYRYLMIPAQNIREVPIIVNHCTEQKELEFEFDEPDYTKLLGSRR